MGPSNEAVSDSDECTVGNDGCTMISERSTSPSSSAGDTPRTNTMKSKKSSFLYSLKGVFVDSFDFQQSPEYADSMKKLIVNDCDVLSYRSEDIDRMSVEEARDLLFQLTLEGHLRKKGFRGWKMWKRRYFRIVGTSLQYFSVGRILRKNNE